MAAVTVPASGNINSSTDTNTYTAGASITPTANDLLVVFTALDNESSTDWVLSDSLGGTYTKIERVLRTTIDPLELWIRDALAPASALTITYGHAAGNAQGALVYPLLVSGMTRTGSLAWRSKGSQTNQTGGTTPAPVLNQAALTGNPVITAVANAASPGNVTVPSTWTSQRNVGHSLNTRGLVIASVNSGFTGTTVTWGGTSASAFASYVVELDTSSPPAGPASDVVGIIPG